MPPTRSGLAWLDETRLDWQRVPAWAFLEEQKSTVGDHWSSTPLLSLTRGGVVLRDIDSGEGKFPSSFDDYQVVEPDDLVFCLFDLDETPRTVGRVRTRGMITSAYTRFSVDLSLADVRFLEWLFISIDDQKALRPLYTGLRKVVQKPRFLAARFALPPINEQRAIADYLDEQTAKIDALIATQNEMIGLLGIRRAAAVDGAFTHNSGRNVRLKYLFRPSGVANRPDEQVLSVYREYGVIPKASRDDNFNKTPENVERYLLVVPGDLVVNRMKAWQGSLGIAADRGIVSGDYEVLNPIDPDLDATYAHHCLRSRSMIEQYGLRSTGIRPSQWRLYWDQMGDLRIPVPSLPEQRTIAAQIARDTTDIDALIGKTREHITLAQERRSALITAAVTGQIDVRTATREVVA